MKRLFRKFRPARLPHPGTKQRNFGHERLEPRLMMTISPSGPEFLVNDAATGFQRIDENASSVAVSDTAGTLAAYAGRGAGSRESIFLRSYDRDGTARGAAVSASSTIQGSRTAAAVAANDAGNAVVVWQGRGPGDKAGIFLQRFDATGAAAGGEQLVNETIGGQQHDPSVAMAADGSFVISWSGPTAGDPAGVSARRFAADGRPLAGETLVNTTIAGDQVASSVAVNSGGDYVIAWSSRHQDGDDWGVYGQRFNAAGERLGGEFAVNTSTVASQHEASVALQDDGSLMVVWSSWGQDGDGWAIVGRRFGASGAAVGGELTVNTSTAGQQRHPQIAGAGGSYLVTWQSGVEDGSGWEVAAQQFAADGNRIGGEQVVNSLLAGANSGHQQRPAAALSPAGQGAVSWSGYGSTDGNGVFGRSFQEDEPAAPNVRPVLAAIGPQAAVSNALLSVTVTATDDNAGDTLTYQLDAARSPAGATIERIDNETAVIHWMPSDAEQNTVVDFRVLVTDNGQPQLEDAEEFQVTVSDGTVLVDLNGADEAGAGTDVTFWVGGDAVSIVDDDLLVVGADGGTISSATAQLSIIRDAGEEFLAVDTLDTNITTMFIANTRTLTLTGDDTQENYQRVLRTLTYHNTAAEPRLTRQVRVRVNDGTTESAIARAEITIGTADLVGFAQALAASDTQFFGAAWCPHCTEQKELFEDGGQFLPFTEVTAADRTRNDAGAANGIEVYPTWIFPDDTRLEGVQSLETLSARSEVAIPLSNDPFIAPIADDALLIGSPLHVPLDGYDPNGGPLTYSVTTTNPLVEATILENIAGNTNRSARIHVAGYGDLVFELFEARAERATNRFIELASDDLANDGVANNDYFYDDVIFHRVIDNFVIQGGDPTGTGGGGTGTDFDDQFHVDLQHNRTGLLSFAKSLEDTNDSQFFITEGESPNLRNLDFHHSIFGLLVEGEKNRAAISDTSVIIDSADVPPGTVDRRIDRPGVPVTEDEFNITMENVEIFTDTENAVLFLKADPGVTGDVGVTVTVSDQQGNTFDRTFTVTVEKDPINGRPFLESFTAPASVPVNTTAQIQLSGIDVEGDAFIYSAERPAGNTVPYTFTVDQEGFVEVTPTGRGTLQITVLVARPGTDLDLIDRFRDPEIDRQLITIEVV